MRVIRKGKPTELECNSCGSLLEYEPTDVKQSEVYRNESYKYVVCPICNSQITINS